MHSVVCCVSVQAYDTGTCMADTQAHKHTSIHHGALRFCQLHARAGNEASRCQLMQIKGPGGM